MEMLKYKIKFHPIVVEFEDKFGQGDSEADHSNEMEAVSMAIKELESRLENMGLVNELVESYERIQ